MEGKLETRKRVTGSRLDWRNDIYNLDEEN